MHEYSIIRRDIFSRSKACFWCFHLLLFSFRVLTKAFTSIKKIFFLKKYIGLWILKGEGYLLSSWPHFSYIVSKMLAPTLLSTYLQSKGFSFHGLWVQFSLVMSWEQTAILNRGRTALLLVTHIFPFMATGGKCKMSMFKQKTWCTHPGKDKRSSFPRGSPSPPSQTWPVHV